MNPDDATIYRQMFEGHPTAQLLVDAETGLIQRANEAATVLYARPGAALTGAYLSELIVDAAAPDPTPLHQRLSMTPLPLAVVQDLGPRGLCHLEVEGSRIATDDATPMLHVTVRDVSEQVHIERNLRDYEELFEDVPVPFYRATTGPTGRFLRVNPAFVRLFDADSAEQLLGLDICSLYVDNTRRAHFSNTLVEQGEVFRHELQLRTVKGREIWTADTAFRHLDKNGEPVIDGVLEDITRRRELEAELSYQARYDKLTDLANRRHCESVLDDETERSDRYGQPLSALMIDVDHFKRVNDTHGHAVGDRVLQLISEVLRHRVRRTDLAGRWGGEEFIVLLPATPTAKALRLAEELRRAVSGECGTDNLTVTISIGYAGYTPQEKTERFLQRLDRALYTAKGDGRNRVILADTLDHDPAPGAPSA